MVLKWGWGAQTILCVAVVLVLEVAGLSGPNVCMVQQKYNITKRVKYRAPMSVRTYVWCFAMPPRCSTWSTEMRELTRLETGERIAEVAVCCPGYKMRDVTCVPICPSGKTGNSCSDDCPDDKWGPNCANDCGDCNNGYCDAITGECECEEGWQGESCQVRMPTTSPPALMEKLLTTTKSTVKTLATSVPIALTTISTTVMEMFPTQKPTIITLPPSINVSTSTENTPITSTPSNKTSSVVKQNISYGIVTVTPSTTLWVENKENVPKTAVTNSIYNRTETPEAEPEHITAVMSDKERDHTSLDLISVISIAGGVMMAVITVAVIIVMVERCKRHRYDDVRKINDIRMQVMIDNSDVPPPYVRSIFHTPLPDPPPSDRNHYQPISTLDRNLKQFMRPVVVQTISPIMLENFRGILECHYDHLPHTNHDFGTMPVRSSVASSMKYDDKLLCQRPLSVADYTIEALKCEAKLDVIDCTTSEPLYAEIPCWRPPSEHAIEVIEELDIVNMNGEAVTEL